MNDQDPKAWQNDPAVLDRRRQTHEDYQWAFAHYGELGEKYLGEWVVVRHQRVIDHDQDLGEVLRRAAEAGFSQDELAVVPFPEFLELPYEDYDIPCPSSD